ncbi:MAG: tRNA adenosine(34) deaminase TadA [Thermoguttaceae bacterium]
MDEHEHFMQLALQEAELAVREGEVPVGAVIVHRERRVIASSHNQREQLQDPTAHAEIVAITQAASALGSWRLDDCTLYVTLEPCPMCAGGIINARIPRLVYGADDPKAGSVKSLFSLLNDSRLNHRTEFITGVLEEQCGSILRRFFQERRMEHRKNANAELPNSVFD